jgi:hypothetical protein
LISNKIFLPIFTITLILIVVIPQTVPSNSQINNSFKEKKGKSLIVDEDEPIIDIITINKTNSHENVLIAFLTHFEGYNIDKVNQKVSLIFNQSFGINSSSYIWSTKLDVNGNFITSLSNGSIFSFSFSQGTINWIHTFSNSAISELNQLENGNFVAITDFGEIFWFYPNNGSIIKYFFLKDTYFTVSKVSENYFVAGNNLGSIFVFNDTTSLYNITIGLSPEPIISLAINNNFFIAYSFNNSAEIYNTSSGDKLEFQGPENLVYDSLFLFDNQLFFSQSNGKLNSYEIDTLSFKWSANLIYAKKLIIGEFNGDNEPDVIVFSSVGNLFSLNPSNGNKDYYEKISDGFISSAVVLDLNQDNINDFLIGTRTGELYIYIGKDTTPPKVIDSTLKVFANDSSILVSFTSNEPVTVSITYQSIKDGKLTLENGTLTVDNALLITNLKPETEYVLLIKITDDSQNIYIFEPIIKKTEASPPDYSTYFLLSGVFGMTAIGGVYYFVTNRNRKIAYEQGEKYYEAGEYIPAIKSFIKAHKSGKERIIEIITFLVSNPQLSSFVDEIKQMEELNEYMIDIQEIIQSSQEF